MNSSTPAAMVRATLRLQFRAGLTLDDATALVPQFARLGISHLYASPLFAARPGSTHGYDTVAHDRIDPALGGEAALTRLADRLHAHGMGLILDIVPNHMAVDAHNAWWMDVLAWGQASAHATWFDIDWHDPDPDLRGRVLLPFLDRPLPEAIVAGSLVLRHDGDGGLFHIHHHEHRFPLCPASYAGLLAQVEAPGALLAAFTTVAVRGGPGAEADSALAALRHWAATQRGQAAMARLATLHDGCDPAGRARLEGLLAVQPWLLACWREAAMRINWRRFFDITGLVGVCVERAEVFEAVHGCLFSLYQRGLVDGVRVDHIDGLAAPATYCQRLRARLDALARLRPENALPGAAIYVEKILASHENLPAAWPVAGTTGYDFMDQVSAVLHDARAVPVLDKLWAACGPEARTCGLIAREARAQLLAEGFAAEFGQLTRLLATALKARGADCTPAGLRMVLEAMLVSFTLYRTYFGDEAVQDHAEDGAAVHDAARAARSRLGAGQEPVLDAVLGILSARPEQAPAPCVRRAEQAFEHLTAPLAAKSTEDTAFYRYARLISRNDVGSDPARLSLTVADFHAGCAARARLHPDAMLTTATHDHKRGEDSRARLAVLSEMAPQWCAQVSEWFARNGAQAGIGPDRIDELMLYQTMLGAWPLTPFASVVLREAWCDRIVQWQTKALREAKRHTNWLDPDTAYEEACTAFTRRLVASAAFTAQMDRMVAWIAPAGALNGLAQTLLRLTTPGVPDLYQGCDLWDFSLVDPDNRRPVDFGLRHALLEHASSFDASAATWRTGQVKLDLIRRILSFRARYPDLFAIGSYQPLELEGADRDHAIAFLRQHDGFTLLVVAPRLPLGMEVQPDTLAVGRDMALRVALMQHAGPWHSLLGAAPVEAAMPFARGQVPLVCLVHDAGGRGMP
ncbi:malto-oligosyltrehalose synthase [Komagataeibacter nataicola]|uniref:malto-oligosyltrehalose synthase n=1 Tax=Komagataeibacter nataicola TaxID=265960 RepID=UPI0023DD1648|nr:malto-oligosyltrehalose synthase [Komagataeibacter nataicola]WEQ56829.1 malto-oligosyltrehalose synthase [Komagataeibacter nataicola]